MTGTGGGGEGGGERGEQMVHPLPRSLRSNTVYVVEGPSFID